MQRREKNPFLVLGIRPDEAKRLAGMDPESRKLSFSGMRAYYAMYHPDRTGNHADNELFGSIAGALNSLEGDGFDGAYNEYRQIAAARPPDAFSRPPADADLRVQQATYILKQAEEKEKNAKGAMGTVAAKNTRIKELQADKQRLEAEIFRWRGVEERLKTSYDNHKRDHKRRLRELRASLSSWAEQMFGVAFGGLELPVPEGAISLRDSGGNVLSIPYGRKMIRISIEDALRYRRVDDTAFPYSGAGTGTLLGSISREVVEGERIGTNEYTRPTSSRYEAVITNIKPYIRMGDHPVTIGDAYGERHPKLLFVWREVADIKPAKG